VSLAHAVAEVKGPNSKTFFSARAAHDLDSGQFCPCRCAAQVVFVVAQAYVVLREVLLDERVLKQEGFLLVARENGVDIAIFFTRNEVLYCRSSRAGSSCARGCAGFGFPHVNDPPLRFLNR